MAQITMLEEKVHDLAWSKEILSAHGPKTEGARGIVGTLNHAWQVWKLLDDGRVVVSIYRVADVPRAEIPAVLARATFPNGGALRRKPDYAESFDIL